MSDGSFEEFINRERERLRGEREAVFNQQHQLENKLNEINRELSAIAADESAKTGKAAGPRPTAARRGPQRGRRGSKREQLLQLIRQNPEGLARKDIIERMGLKGDKSGEMSVSNALTALIKTSQVARREGKYVIE